MQVDFATFLECLSESGPGKNRRSLWSCLAGMSGGCACACGEHTDGETDESGTKMRFFARGTYQSDGTEVSDKLNGVVLGWEGQATGML